MKRQENSTDQPSAAKRRRILPLSVKSTILNRLAEGVSAHDLARCYYVSESVIRRIGKQQATIRAAVATLDTEGAKGALRQRNLRFYKMEACLLTWLEDMRTKRLPVWSTKICTKAMEIYEEIGDFGYEDSVEFLASFSWFARFRKKHVLPEVRPHGDRSTASEVQFISTLKNTIREGGFSREQIFMVERTTFWWKRFPGWSEEESISLMVCCNASGDFFTFYKPEAEDDLDCSFLTWFVEQFVPQRATYLQRNGFPKDSLLILASDLGWPTNLSEDAIKIKILPPDCNSSLLPAVLGILEHLNAVYLKHLSEYLLSGYKLWNDFTLDQALKLLASSIPQLHKTTLTIAWTKLLQDLPGRICNEKLLIQIAANATILQNRKINFTEVRNLLKPAELSTEEVIELFHKRQLEKEARNPTQATTPMPPPVDPTLVPEIDRHLAALTEARAFFEAHDQNEKRQEAISKRLEQVCGWAVEMRSELVDKGYVLSHRVEFGEVSAPESSEPYEEITIKEESLGLDSDSE